MWVIGSLFFTKSVPGILVSRIPRSWRRRVKCDQPGREIAGTGEWARSFRHEGERQKCSGQNIPTGTPAHSYYHHAHHHHHHHHCHHLTESPSLSSASLLSHHHLTVTVITTAINILTLILLMTIISTIIITRLENSENDSLVPLGASRYIL